MQPLRCGLHSSLVASLDRLLQGIQQQSQACLSKGDLQMLIDTAYKQSKAPKVMQSSCELSGIFPFSPQLAYSSLEVSTTQSSFPLEVKALYEAVKRARIEPIDNVQFRKNDSEPDDVQGAKLQDRLSPNAPARGQLETQGGSASEHDVDHEASSQQSDSYDSQESETSSQSPHIGARLFSSPQNQQAADRGFKILAQALFDPSVPPSLRVSMLKNLERYRDKQRMRREKMVKELQVLNMRREKMVKELQVLNAEGINDSLSDWLSHILSPLEDNSDEDTSIASSHSQGYTDPSILLLTSTLKAKPHSNSSNTDGLQHAKTRAEANSSDLENDSSLPSSPTRPSGELTEAVIRHSQL